jgi:hypothetical protein
MLSGRRERRGGVNFTARLQSVSVPSYVEPVSIKNLSSHGARVITTRPLQVHDRVMLIASIGDFHVAGEVIYCQRLNGNRCAVGLSFPEAVETE